MGEQTLEKKGVDKKDSLKKRYFYKLLTNFAGLGISACTQVIIPRGLGPKIYGDYYFLLNFFSQLINFFDMGSSTGFYIKLSQRPQESRLIVFYSYFLGTVGLIALSFVGIAHISGLSAVFWPDQISRYVYASVLLALLIWMSNVMSSIADAYGLTVPMEIVKISQKICGLSIIVVLFMLHRLTLGTFFLYNYFILLLLAAGFCYITGKNALGISAAWKVPVAYIKKYISEFYAYSHPFFLYSLAGMIAGVFDRWLLQVYAGSVEQGFLGLSYQVGALCFMFTGAMTPLIMREFSIAFKNKDLKLMAAYFRKYVPFLYSITALLACFIAVNAHSVALMMGGGRFQGATAAVAVMAFYPVHQTYGQLSGSVFYASDRTKLYCNIGIIFMIVSLPVTYFLIAPATAFGMNAGAIGIACKLVLLQFLAVNVQLYFNCRLLGLRFWKYAGHQLASVMVFLCLAFFSRFIVEHISILRKGIVSGFISGGIVYLGMVFVLIFAAPRMIGVNKSDWKILFRGRNERN